uniref:Retrotransposon gag domain-containing protein n=1 Tax=Picea glauca TaxID=3330 RepID=A0A101LVS9_PICGL|nr:hypothetical protein ABT39_MTgene1751 [Picea glauca]QHR88415.1 hypothetical protein Q903MT_gene2428 [Picea sitchensis]
MAKLFPHTLTRLAFEWFSNLPKNSIETFYQLCSNFLGMYALKPIDVSEVVSLIRLKQGKLEVMTSFIHRF